MDQLNRLDQVCWIAQRCLPDPPVAGWFACFAWLFDPMISCSLVGGSCRHLCLIEQMPCSLRLDCCLLASCRMSCLLSALMARHGAQTSLRSALQASQYLHLSLLVSASASFAQPFDHMHPETSFSNGDLPCPGAHLHGFCIPLFHLLAFLRRLFDRSGYHTWRFAGSVGVVSFQCRRCFQI